MPNPIKHKAAPAPRTASSLLREAMSLIDGAPPGVRWHAEDVDAGGRDVDARWPTRMRALKSGRGAEAMVGMTSRRGVAEDVAEWKELQERMKQQSEEEERRKQSEEKERIKREKEEAEKAEIAEAERLRKEKEKEEKAKKGEVFIPDVCGLIFPGQGAHYTDMITKVIDMKPIRDLIDRSKSILGYDIMDIIQGDDTT